MPGVFYDPISRKKFLGVASGLVGGLVAGRRTEAADETPESDDTASNSARIALLSDTHIPADASNEYRGFRPVDNLKKVVPQVVQSKPDAAILNGDAARLTGEHNDYVALKALLQPAAEEAPIHIGLGNHDDRKNFFQVFDQPTSGESLVSGKHVSTFESAGTRFVVLDSLLYVDKVAGLLGKSQRTWLAKFLAGSDDRPIVFFVHHSLGDGDGDLLDFQRAFEIMKPYRQVKAIFYGHSHRYHIEQKDHIFLVNQPAIGYNFADSQPVGWLDAHFTQNSVAMKLNAIGGNVNGDQKTTVLDWD